MRYSESVPADVPTWSPDSVVCRDNGQRPLLEVAARAVAQRGCDDLDYAPVLGRRVGVPEALRRKAIQCDARAEATPADTADRIDAEAVAAWICEQYPAPAYPAVVLGSPHGAAVHLAAALGAPWLPTGFTVSVAWPDGSVGDWETAMGRGAAVAERLLCADPGVTVRQVHDPVQRGPLCASTLTLHVQWCRLPRAYRDFLQERLRPGGSSLLLRDVRRWPVRRLSPGCSFQVGSPASGRSLTDFAPENAAFRRLLDSMDGGGWADPRPGAELGYAETAGDPRLEPQLRELAGQTDRRAHRVLYAGPEALSGSVADLHLQWSRTLGRGGERCVLETGRLLDPWRVLAAGAVPYWLESASRHAATAAEEWLAGSAGFDDVTVLPQPPGTDCDAHADRGQWRAMAAFAGRRSHVDPQAMARYPLLPLPTGHAARVLNARTPSHRFPPALMPMNEVLRALREHGHAWGLLVE